MQSLAFAFGAGALVSVVSSRLRIPAVLPLMVVGIVLGPSAVGLVEFSSVGDLFRVIVSLSIGLLVFEGGLHLDREELSRAPRAVLGMLSTGAAVTWLGSAAAAHYLGGFGWLHSFVLGSLVIVTGPTVVQPILRSVRVTPRLRSVLASEAILVDPIGVIGAVAMLEVVRALERGGLSNSWESILFGLSGPFLGGVLVGAAVAGFGVVAIRLLGPKANLNLTAFSLCMIAIGAGELIAPEGGLVAATVAGVILSNLQAVKTSDVRSFKEQLASILVGMLFVLLSSNFDLAALQELGWIDLALVAAVLFVVRPAAVALGTAGSMLSWRERFFAAFFAPRGVVATAVASLTAGELAKMAGQSGGGAGAVDAANRIGSIVVLLVVISVTWATLLAWPLARLLRVLVGPPRGVMIVGAHALGRAVAMVARERGVPVVLIDTNAARCEIAASLGIEVHQSDATDLARLSTIARERDIGWVLAWTGNIDVDRVVERWGREALDDGHATLALPCTPHADGERAAARSQVARELDLACAEGRVRFAWRESAGAFSGEPVLRVKGDQPVGLGAGRTGSFALCMESDEVGVGDRRPSGAGGR